MTSDQIWMAVGFLAQGMFSMRFLAQWIATERAKRSVVPMIFWYLSIVGGALLLTYAIHRKDPVFIVGQSAGLFVYFRNIYIIKFKERPELAE